MSKLRSIVTVCAIGVLVAHSPHSLANDHSDFKGKNVVLIYADDLGWGQVGYNGQKYIIPPNLDKYASQGLKFNNFYTSAPFCPPARNSLMTGLDTSQSKWRAKAPITYYHEDESTIAQMFIYGRIL